MSARGVKRPAAARRRANVDGRPVHEISAKEFAEIQRMPRPLDTSLRWSVVRTSVNVNLDEISAETSISRASDAAPVGSVELFLDRLPLALESDRPGPALRFASVGNLRIFATALVALCDQMNVDDVTGLVESIRARTPEAS